VIREAFEEARRQRRNWLGPEHYLLAVLAEPSPATEAMAELGVTYDRLAPRLAEVRTVNGRRTRYFASRYVTTNPASHQVRGWATGFAAARGRESPSPEDWLLAVVYGDHGTTMSALHEFGVSAADVVDALRRRRVETPDFQPEEYRPWRGHRTVEVARSEWQAVVDVLGEKHPPGSEWRWGFNSRRDRPGRIQFMAEDGLDLESIVAEAAQKG